MKIYLYKIKKTDCLFIKYTIFKLSPDCRMVADLSTTIAFQVGFMSDRRQIVKATP